MSVISLLTSIGRLGDLAERSSLVDRLASALGVEPHEHGRIEARIHSLLALRDGVTDGEDPAVLRALADDLADEVDDWAEDLADARQHAADYRLHSVALAEVDAALRGVERGVTCQPWPAEDDGGGQIVVDRAVQARAEIDRLASTVLDLRVSLAATEPPAGWERSVPQIPGVVVWVSPTAALTLAVADGKPLQIASRGSVTLAELVALLRCELRQQGVEVRS